MNNTHTSPSPDSANLNHFRSSALLRRYRFMIYGGLILIILLTLGNTLYLSNQLKSQLLNQLNQTGMESMLTLNQTLSVSLNHIDRMKDALETAHQYPQLIPNDQTINFLSKQTLGSPEGAPLENLPPDLRHKLGQLYVRSNPRDYSFDVRTLLTMIPEVVSTHQQYDDFQWSYYYDADQVITYIYPFLSYSDLLAATETDNMDDALDVIFEAGGTFPLKLINPRANPSKQKVWTTPYMDAGGKGMMVSLLAPVYHNERFVGSVGTDITLSVLDKILTKRPLETGRLVIVDSKGLVVGDSNGALKNITESITQHGILTLLSVAEAHRVMHGEMQQTTDGYWVSFMLPDTPWRLVLEITDGEIFQHVFDKLLPNLIMATTFTVLLLCVVLYQHWNFSQPALRLAQFVEDLPRQDSINPPNVPERWQARFQRAIDREQDRRSYLRTIEQQTEDLEHRVNERTLELEQTLEALKATQEELVRSEKLSGLGSLVAGVAHELNTPIGNAMIVASSLKDFNQQFVESTKEGLRRSALDNYIKQSTESSESIERNLRRASELISSFKQVAVDQSSYQRRTFVLREIMRELQVTMLPSLSRQQVQLETECEEFIEMDSYPGPLTQVMMNLLSNALVHAFSDQQVKVISIKGQLQDQCAIITVSDNGHGIASENQSKIFDPFFTTRLGQGGSGLGLNIVYNLVTGLLGGDIQVTSEPEQGSCFTLTLPLNAPQSDNIDA